jgi:hypothetical protein
MYYMRRKKANKERVNRIIFYYILSLILGLESKADYYIRL